MIKPKCFSFFDPYIEECLINCSFREECQKLQEKTIEKKYNDYLEKKDLEDNISLDQIIEIDDLFQ